MNAPTQIVPPYRHTPLFPLGKDNGERVCGRA